MVVLSPQRFAAHAALHNGAAQLHHHHHQEIFAKGAAARLRTFVTVLEASGSILDANLLGTKVYQLSGGSQTFTDLGLQGDAGTHFRLRFSYNTLTVESNEFNVKPNHVFVSVHPSDGQYYSGSTGLAQPKRTSAVGSLCRRGTEATTC
jgi:hypothetical protein